MLDRLNAAGIPATPLHVVEPGCRRPVSDPAGGVERGWNGSAFAGASQRQRSGRDEEPGHRRAVLPGRCASRPPGGRRRPVAHQSVSIQRLRRRFAGEGVRIAERAREQRASFKRSHQAYGEVMGVAPTRCLEAQTGVVAAPVPSILPTPAKLLKFGDRVRFAGARREQVKHLDARAERLDAARDRPRDTSSPRAEFRRGPMPLRTGVPGGAWPCRRAPSVREADERLAGFCTG